jgi:CheY-like chemotaxis protein
MGPEQTARLFDRFTQVHADSGRMQAGVGLGLSICMLYCKAMGGTIAVDSEPGRGSTFTVTLPAEIVSVAAPPTGPRLAMAPGTAPSPARRDDGHAADGRANLVLIIDDDESICELMRRMLGEQGYSATAALSGEEGLRLAKQLLPSAIILDVVMPGIDGWAVLAALKTDAKTAEIPIIMASMLDEKERGLRMGADEYVAKPLGRDELAGLLHKHLGDRPAARILVVEDDEDCRRRTCAALRGQGWEAIEAVDADEALARLAEATPDLILLDLMLPGRSGLEVVVEVRSNPAWEGIPILVVTAAELDAEARARLKGQVERVLSKGVLGRDDLLREVRALVSRHHDANPVPPPEVAHA